jgi:S-formylglutathione hydrolase FrmB
MMAAFHPDHFRYAGSVSGVLDAVEKPLATRQ